MSDSISDAFGKDEFTKRKNLNAESERLVDEFATEILDGIQTISNLALPMKKFILDNKKLKHAQYLLNQMLDPHASIYPPEKR